MTDKEKVLDSIRGYLVDKIDPHLIPIVEDSVVLALSGYQLTETETHVVPYDGGDIDILKRFFIAKTVEGLTANSLQYYKEILEKSLIAMQKHIKDIETSDVRLYLALKKANHVSDKTLNNIRRVLSSFFSWCAAEDIVAKNPMLRIANIKEAKRQEYALTDEQMEMLRYSCGRNLRNAAIIEFLYSTGCRVSEMCALNRADIDFIRCECEVFGKGRKYRTVYLTQRCIFALKAYLENRTDDNEALFLADYAGMPAHLRKSLNITPKRADKSCVRAMFQTLSKKLGFRVHPHLLRKTVATKALTSGMPVDQVQKMLGHSDINTTMIYAQTNADDVKVSHRKFIN